MNMKALGILGAAIAMLLLPAAPLAAPVGTQVADCERGPIMRGTGPPDWRQRSSLAGPLGVRLNPLRDMSRTRNGQFLTKMPVGVEGHRAVTLSVPPRLRHRAFLYFGKMLDRNGQPTTSFRGSRGFSVVEFRPCSTKPRTLWPGGIRVKGRRAVRLIVRVEGSPEPIPLPLGRPKAYAPTS